MNPYDVLGCSSVDSLEVIKRRYRELSKVYHPDNPVTGDSGKFQEVNKAFNLLKEIKSGENESYIWVHKTLFTIRKEKF